MIIARAMSKFLAIPPAKIWNSATVLVSLPENFHRNIMDQLSGVLFFFFLFFLS